MQAAVTFIEERKDSFVVKGRLSSRFCLVTAEPDGAIGRLKESVSQRARIGNLLGNPAAAASLVSGGAMKLGWEAVFCPVHGIIGKVVAGAIIIATGIASVESWENASAFLEWTLPALLVSQAAYSVHRSRKAAKAILQAGENEISVQNKDQWDCCQAGEQRKGLLGWISMPKESPVAVFYKSSAVKNA